MLEVKNLYVGYYRDLNILQDLTLAARPGRSPPSLVPTASASRRR